MKTAAFVITLSRAIHRQTQVQRIVSSSPWSCAISPAVDGSALTPEEIAHCYRRRLHSPFYPHELRLGEIGCFLSHRCLWQQIVDEEIDLALILEDDVDLLLPEFDRTLEFAAKHAQAGDYLQFQVRDIGQRHPVVHRGESARIVQPRITPLRTSAQLVTRDAARCLLAASVQFDRPVDVFLQMRWVTGVPVKVVIPSNIVEVSQQLGGSTISGGRKPWLTRMRRELLRPLYRSQVALWSLLSSDRRAG